jgi:hypothetical protein
MPTTLDLASIKPSLDKLQALERELTALLIERDEVIRASLVTLLARQRLVVLGPPGTTKSALVTSLAESIGPQKGSGLTSVDSMIFRITSFMVMSSRIFTRAGPQSVIRNSRFHCFGRNSSQKISPCVTSSGGTTTVGMKNAAPSDPGSMPTPIMPW